MTNKFSCFLTQKGRWLTATLFLLFSLGIGNMWGAVTTDVYNASGASTDTDMAKTGSALSGTYIAGQGGGNIAGYSPNNKGVKLRTKQTTVTISETTYGYVVITANSGYKLKSIKVEGTSNNSTKTVPMHGVYVDVNATNATTLATSIAAATNQLSSSVDFPGSSTTYVSSPALSINASTNIVLLFDNGGDYNNQMRAIITVGYEKLTYDVTYLPGENGGGSVDAQVKTYGENLTLSSSTFSRENHTQAGWSLTDGGEKAYELGGTYTGNAALTLYPYWVSATATSHSISYDGLKGSDVSSYPTSFYEGVGVASFDPLADITGWHFTGWSPSSIGAEATTDQTITAQWTPVYAVSFNLQDHGSAIDPQNVISGQKASEPEEPEANGWGFGGWYKEAACTNAWDFSTETVTEATELFAKWTEFDCSGTGTMFSISSLSGTQKVAKTTDANNPTWMNLSTYGTITGGKAKAGNKDASNDRGGVNTGRIAWDSGNAILWLHFNCPIATGDKMIVTGFNPDGGALYVRKAYSTTTDQLTIDKDNTEITIPAAFDGLYDIYLWRNGNTTTYVTGITVTRTSCDKPSTPTVTVNDKTYKSATIVLDGGTTMPTGTVGYKVYVEKTSDHTVIRDWVDCATQEYALTGLEAETTYTVKAKAVGGEGKCALGDESDGVDFATLVKTCPTSGVVFSMALKSGASTRSLNSGASYNLTSSDVTIEGGSASIKNIDPDNNGKMKISSGPKFDFQGNKAYVKVVLDCPLQAGDKIEIAGGSGKQIAITPTEGIPTDASVKVTTSSYTYTITAADVTAGFAGPTILTYYLGRADASSTQITGITITRPYAITFANGGHGTAPSSTTGFEVALTQITGVDGWIHTGWTANKVVKIGGSDVAVGTAVAVDATATVNDDTQFTAVWEEDIPAVDPTITFNNGNYTIAGAALNLSTLFSSNSSGAVTYTVKTDGGTSASIDGTSFTATAAGTCVVTASQAAVTGYNAATADANIVVSAPSEVDGVKLVEAGALTGNFRTSASLSSTAHTVAGIAYPKYIGLSARTSWSSQPSGPDNYLLQYTLTKKTNKFYFYAYNTNGGVQNVKVYVKEEGENCTTTNVPVSANSGELVSCDVNVSKNAEVCISVSATSLHICQVVVVESGDDQLVAPAVNYNINFNKGRLTAKSGTAKTFEGITYCNNADYKIDNSTYLKLTTRGTHYVSFEIPTGQTRKLQVTTGGSAYNVSKTLGDNTTATKTGNHDFNLGAGVWYINPQGSDVTITNLKFIAADAAITVTFNSNGGSDVDAQPLFAGDVVTAPSPAPTKSGYRFVGWQKSGVDYDFSTELVEGDAPGFALDAVWQETVTITFDPNNGEDTFTKNADKGAKIATGDIPANPTYAGYDFQGWTTDLTAEPIVHVDLSATTFSEATTLKAHWEVAQDDATLSALSYNGNAINIASAEDVSGVQTYTVHLPWGSTIDPVLVSVTKNAETATVGTLVYDSENKRISFDVESGNHAVLINYAIQFVIDPKRGTSIIKAVTANNTVTGLIGGTRNTNLSNGASKKLNTETYFGMTLAGDETFQEGDVIIVNITAAADLGKFMVYADAERTQLVADQGIVYTKPTAAVPVLCPTGEMMMTLPAAANGKKSLYISREDGNTQWNVTFSSLEVVREMSPVIKSFKFGDDAATINEAAKTITIEVPFSTDVTALTPTVEAYGNNGATYTPSGATNFTSPVDYVVTDAYSELSTTYAVTVTKAPASTNANLASLAVAGYSLDFDPAEVTYNVVLDYGTTVLPAITYEVAEVGLATAEKVEGGVNGATTITVTPEAGAGYEKVYTINFSVSTNPKYVIYDGSTMTNIASATGVDGSTGFSYSLASNIPLSGDPIASSWGGKDYTYVIKGFKPNDNSSNIVSFVVPEGYVAKVRLVGTTNSTGTERQMFIAMNPSKNVADAISDYIITSSTYDAQGFITDYLLPNTYYLGSTDSYRLYEFSVTLYPIDEERAMTQGRFGTICYPNGGRLLGAMLLEIAYFDADQKKIFFDEVIGGQMVAGAPYLFLPNEGVDKFAIVYTDNVNALAGHHNGLYGSYTQEALPTDGNHYIMLNNQYCKVVEANTYVGANRAYIQLDKIGNDYVAPAYGRRRVSLGVQQAEVATGLEDLNVGDQPIKIMINGQMYILRGEKMYDATGRLVK